MQTLRWILGLSTATCTLGFLGLVIFADGFRRSIGASANSPVKIGLIFAIQILLLLTIALPQQRFLMHVTAAAVVALVAGFVWTLRESVFVGTTGLIYCVLWFAYYKLAVWGTP